MFFAVRMIGERSLSPVDQVSLLADHRPEEKKNKNSAAVAI